MQTNMPNTVICKFNELIHSLNHFADDIKIACAEASLEGDFKLVAKLSNDSLKIQGTLKEVISLSNSWSKGLARPTHDKNNQGNEIKKTYFSKKPPTRLCVTIAGKQILEKKAADTFVSAIEHMGIERVSKLSKNLSGIPLLSKVQSTGYHTQKQSGSWYITTHSSTKNMKIILEEIGRSLRIPIQVKIVKRD
jgi:hypothetical protein